MSSAMSVVRLSCLCQRLLGASSRIPLTTTVTPTSVPFRGHSHDSGSSKKGKTPTGKLDDPWSDLTVEQNPAVEHQPLEKFPDNTNPQTGEIDGPRGPEPTRYGDWERKGRVTDF
ncbi:succinate dehydrogenase assembly factor 4, mitochondrial-like [Argonauta hians]